MNGNIPHSRDTFVNATTEDFRKMLYDLLVWDHKCTQERRDVCEKRFDKIEKSKWVDKGVAAGSGFLGGAAAMIAYLFGKGQ